MTDEPSTSTGTDPKATPASDEMFELEQAGYAKTLEHRHLQMMALGGAIGTGLFLGAGARLHTAGPILALLYALCGVVVFFVVRALAELVLYRPSSGSFVSYSRQFLGERAAFVAGWMYFVLWAFAGIADITAVALYAKYWSVFGSIPQWVIALGALVCVLIVNLVSARAFGEIEFWAAGIKVVALGVFLAIGIYFIVTRKPVDGEIPGIHLIAENGGWVPHGLLPALLVIPGVVFAYSSLELVSVAAGETRDPAKVVPKATNAVVWRLGIFYVGSVLLLALLLPWSAYSADESPFVTFFSAIGVPAAGSIMNFVVITAALSSVNSGLFATGRILRTMATTGSAPRRWSAMSGHHVPARAIGVVCAAYVLGIVLNLVVPQQAFEVVLNFAALGILSTWAFTLLSHLAFLRAAKKGLVTRPAFRMPGAPYVNWILLAFLVGVLVLMWFDWPVGRITVIAIIPIAVLLWIGIQLTERKARSNDDYIGGKPS